MMPKNGNRGGHGIAQKGYQMVHGSDARIQACIHIQAKPLSCTWQIAHILMDTPSLLTSRFPARM